MSKISPFKRIYYTDYPQQFQDLVSQLADTLNTSLSSITTAFTNGVGLRDNLAVTVKDVTVMVDSTGTPTSTTAFTISNTNAIDGIQVISAAALNQNTPVFPTGGIFVSFTQSQNKVTIINTTGIPANIPFTLRIIAYLT